VFRRDVFESAVGQAVLEAMRSEGFRTAVMRLGGYAVERSGTVKSGAGAASAGGRRTTRRKT